jgi:hypothetical protein
VSSKTADIIREEEFRSVKALKWCMLVFLENNAGNQQREKNGKELFEKKRIPIYRALNPDVDRIRISIQTTAA